jgi:hypothetical protein
LPVPARVRGGKTGGYNIVVLLFSCWFRNGLLFGNHIVDASSNGCVV